MNTYDTACKAFRTLYQWFLEAHTAPDRLPKIIIQFPRRDDMERTMHHLRADTIPIEQHLSYQGEWNGLPYKLTYFDDDWHRMRDVSPPSDEIFIWACPDGRNGWSLGLAYHNVSGGTSDAYGNNAGLARATHWKAIGALPK
jgi:hypothetical protein